MPSDAPKPDNFGDATSALKTFILYRREVWRNRKLIIDDDGSNSNKPKIITPDNRFDQRPSGSNKERDNSDDIMNRGGQSVNSNSTYKRRVWKNGVLVVDEETNDDGRNNPENFSNFGNFSTNFDTNFGGTNFGGTNFGGNNFTNHFGGGFSAFDQPGSYHNYKRQVWKNDELVVDEDTSRNSAISNRSTFNNQHPDYFNSGLNYQKQHNSNFDDFTNRFNQMGNFGSNIFPGHIGFEGLNGLNGQNMINNNSVFNSQINSNFNDNFNRRSKNFYMDIRSNRVEDNCSLM